MRKKRHLDNWLKTFCETFQNTESPEKYVYWIGVGTVGAALQRNVVFDQITFQLYPNHYIILVGPPAVKKTTAIYFGIDRLRQIGCINVGPSSVTWQYLVDKLKEIQTATPEEMARTGAAIKDSCPMVLPAGELGTLIDFDDRASIDFFTNAWESPKVYDKGTRMMGDQVLNGPCLSIIAGTTPQWIKDHVHGATRGGGFISRCIMPYSDLSREIIAYPRKLVKVDHSEQLSRLEHDLLAITDLNGEYTLSPEAEQLGETWYKQVSIEQQRTSTGADSDNWINRRYSHVHKLAMVLAACKRDKLIIEKEDMQEAIARIEDISKDFNKVFAMLDERKETRGIKEIESLIKTAGQLLLTDVYTKMRTKFTKREIAEGLDVLIAGRIIEKEHISVSVKGADGTPQVVVAIVLKYRGDK